MVSVCVLEIWFANYVMVVCWQYYIITLLRLQAQPSNTSDAYKGMFDAFRRTFRLEGFKGFYKGLFPNLLKVVPAASITYVAYESLKNSLDLD